LLDWRPIPYGEAHEDVGYLVTGCKQQEADGEDEKAADGPKRGSYIDFDQANRRNQLRWPGPPLLHEESTQM
jgi:hypothetical protein